MTTLLRFLLLLSGVFHDIAVRCCCSAFHAAPPAQLSSKSKLPSLQLPPTYTSCKTDDARRRILSSTTPTTTTTVLFGYANVNDYFNSFQQNDDSSGSDDGGRDGTSSSWSPSNTPKEFKYIGHGRIRSSSDSDNNNGDDEAAEGGVFDINNYFSSFGQQQQQQGGGFDNNDEEVDSENDGSYEHQTDTTSYEQPPPRQRLTMEQIIANNNARLCPKSFLTQAAIQSFIYLLEECRDPHSGSWIQDFLGVQNLGNYHGTAAFDVSKYPSWESVLVDIMSQPNQKIIIRAKRRGRGHGGWSKNNPYLQERYVEFPIDIQPASLVQRLLTVREQLATEFERDLEIVGIVDGMIIESYFDTVKREREEQQQQQQQQQQRRRDEDGWSSSGGDDEVIAPVTRAFDRISVDILSNFTEFTSSSGGASSSVFRKGNFDLLYNLCTQASVHHLLRELRESKVDKISYQWLQAFYSERVCEYFDGDVAFGRGDDFIDALLRSPPSLVSMDDGHTLGLTDPLRLAERVIAKRSEIAFAWIEEMREVKNDHLALNDKLFRVMMGKAVNVQDEEAVTIEEERTWDLADDTGMFE